LEHVPDGAAAELGQTSCVQLAEVAAVDQHLALGGAVEAAGDGEQGGLSRAAGAHDRHKLARLDAE
jgi:hypothetical protein